MVDQYQNTDVNQGDYGVPKDIPNHQYPHHQNEAVVHPKMVEPWPSFQDSQKKNYSRATFDVWIRYGYNEALETKKSNWPTFLGEQGTNVNCMLLIVQLSQDFVSDNSLWQKKKFQYLKWCSLSKILTETKSWDNQTIRSWTLFVLKYTDFRCPVLLRKSVNLLFFVSQGFIISISQNIMVVLG